MAIKTPTMQELLEAGVHFGHKVSRGNPRMSSFIFGARDGVHIIDLAKSEEELKKTSEAAFEYGKEGKVMLVVGTKKQAQEIVKTLADAANTPYLNQTWVSGLFTNFDEIKKNIKRLNDTKVEQEKGTLSRYTKKEQLLISRKINKFNSVMGGVSALTTLPDAIFVVDAVSDNIAVKEAQKTGIKVFGLCDTNANPDWFDFPVPANDDGIKSIKIICETVLGAYAEGKKQHKPAGSEPELKTEAKKEIKKETKAAEKVEEKLDEAVAEEAAVIEEEIEKVVVAESERKVE